MPKKIKEPIEWEKARKEQAKKRGESTSGKTSWSKKAYMRDLEKADPNYKDSGQERSDDIFKDIEGM